MNADPIAGPRAKVERAKGHFQELQRAINSFLATTPYEVGADRDASGRIKGSYRVTRVEDVPIQIAAIAGDILNNLRGALDHLAYGAVSTGLGHAPANPTAVQYPIANSAGEYPAMRNRMVNGARQDAVDAIDATKPFAGGNDVIWRIHKLNNIDKHRYLLTAGSALRSVNFKSILETTARGFRYSGPDGIEKISGVDRTYPDIWFKQADPMFPLAVGMVLPSFAIDPDKKMEYRFEVAFSEPPIVNGEPLLETFHKMIETVDGLLPGFAAALS